MQPSERNRSACTVQWGAASSVWHIKPPLLPEKARRLQQLAVQDHKKIDKLWTIPWRLMGLGAGSPVGNARINPVPLKIPHRCSAGDQTGDVAASARSPISHLVTTVCRKKLSFRYGDLKAVINALPRPNGLGRGFARHNWPEGEDVALYIRMRVWSSCKKTASIPWIT